MVRQRATSDSRVSRRGTTASGAGELRVLATLAEPRIWGLLRRVRVATPGHRGDGCPYWRHVPGPYVHTMKNKRKPTKMLDLDQEIVADLEASEQDTEAVKGGAFTNNCGSGGTRTGNT